MKTLLFCILALAIGGVYYYWRNASELRPETPAEIPMITKAREMFPDNAEKQRNWLKEARAFAEKIEKISPPKSAEDLGAIKSRAERLYRFEFAKKYDYVSSQTEALKALESYADDAGIKDSEYALIRETVGEKYPEDFVKQRALANSYWSMFADIRNAEENSSPDFVKKIYGDFIAEFKGNPAAAFAKFANRRAANDRFEGMEIPSELDGAREYVAKNNDDVVSRLSELAALAESPRKWLDKSLLQNARSDWKNFGKIKEEHKALIQNSIYAVSLEGKTHTAVLVSLSLKKYFVTSAFCYSDKKTSLEFLRGNEKINGRLAFVGDNLLFFAPDGEPDGVAIHSEFEKSAPTSASAFGANAFGKIISTYCSVETIQNGRLVFFESGNQDLLATESFIVSGDADRLLAFGVRGVPSPRINPDALPLEDIFAKIRLSKNPLPNVFENFQPLRSRQSAESGELNYWLVGHEMRNAQTYRDDISEMSKKTLSKFTRQNNALLAFLCDNRYEVLVGGEMGREYPEISTIAKKCEKFFFNSKGADERALKRVVCWYLREMYKEINSSMHAFGSAKILSSYNGAFAEQTSVRKAILKTLADGYSDAAKVSETMPQDLLSGLQKGRYTPPSKR